MPFQLLSTCATFVAAQAHDRCNKAGRPNSAHQVETALKNEARFLGRRDRGGWSEENREELRGPPRPERPESECLRRGGANAVNAAVHAEKESVGLGSADQVAAAVRTEAAVIVMLFDVAADLLGITNNVATWGEKEIFGDHGVSAGVPPWYRFSRHEVSVS